MVERPEHRRLQKGLNAILNELVEERWKGRDFFRHQDSRTRGFRSGTLTLLPPYDEYLIGYKSRQVAVRPEHMGRVHSGTGIFWPVILQDGVVVGNWSAAGGEVRADFFNPEFKPDQTALDKEIARFCSYYIL